MGKTGLQGVAGIIGDKGDMGPMVGHTCDIEVVDKLQMYVGI